MIPQSVELYGFGSPAPATWPVLILAVVAVLVVGLLVARIFGRQSDHRRRLDLLDRALRREDLDVETRRQLLQAIAPPQREWHWSRLGFALGWLGIFACGGWLAMDPKGDDFYVALFALLMSFGVVTLPLAMRELDNRRQAP